MVKTGEGFYTSLGLPPLPETFWERSLITRPRDREVVCHASAWDIDDKDDIRIKMCTRVNAEDFDTVHHELGHNYYQRAYAGQDYIFRGGANDGFHEAIGDFAGLNAHDADLSQPDRPARPRARHRGGHPVPAEDGARQDRLPALRAAGRQMALGGVLRRDAARALQRCLVGAAHALSGHRAAGSAPGGRLRSRREVPHPRQHALCALLPGPHLRVPVLPRRLPRGGLEGAAQPLLGLRQ